MEFISSASSVFVAKELMAKLETASSSKLTDGSQPKRIAIVGGGIAGLYVAWRLLQQKTKIFDLHLYEMDSNVGGRIRSVDIPGIPFFAELGAMRFRPRHLLLNSLISKLDLSKVSFDLPSPAFHFRGRSLSVEELTAGRCDRCKGGSPFLLRENERGESPVSLVQRAIQSALNGLSFPGLTQGEARRVVRRLKDGVISQKTWKTIKKYGVYQGLHLYSVGFWNLLQHFLSNEALVLVRDVLSLESILGNWNAAEAIPWFLEDFASDQYEMIPGGMSRIITELVSQLKSLSQNSAGSKFQIHSDSNVTKVAKNDGCWEVQFTRRADGSTGTAEIVDGYDYAILALPKVAMQRLQVDNGEPWPPPWLEWVREHRMFKLFLLYDHEWWIGDRLPGYDNGRVFTDLPLRQIYYFSPTWMSKHGLGSRNSQSKKTKYDELALVMASYSDEHNVSFWEPMLTSQHTTAMSLDRDQPYLHQSSRVAPELWKRILNIDPGILANSRMVDKVQRQLSEIHGRELPEPILGVFKDWGCYPFGGGWHTWNVGTCPWEVENERVEPIANSGLFLCGEAYSNEQGWMEGALKSAELVLKKMDIDAPYWIKFNDISEFHDYIDVPGRVEA